MKKKLTKKQIAVIVILVIAGIFIVNHAVGKLYDTASKWLGTKQQEEEAQGEDETADTAATEEDKTPTKAEELGLTEEEYQAYADSGNAFFPEGTEGEVNVYDKDGTQQVMIGNYAVTFDGSYASAGDITFSSEGLDIDMLVYDDGNKNDTKAFFMAYPIMGSEYRPSSIDGAKAVLTELIVTGSGTVAEWEETENYFIRKISGFDNDDSAAIISYNLVPKKMTEENVYQIVFTASKSGTATTPVSEDSFNSIIDAIKEDVSDSELLYMNYEELKEDLLDLAFYEAADDGTSDGLRSLQDAYKSYLIDTYGTTDVDSLTEEEKEIAEWKAQDYEGYREYMLYEKGIDIEAGDSAASSSTETE